MSLSAITVLALAYRSIANDFKVQSQETMNLGKETYALFKAQNLPHTTLKLQELEKSFQKTRTDYQQFRLPLNLLGQKNKYEDGLALMAAADSGLQAAKKTIAVITPHADVLGFSVEKKAEGGVAEDRIKKLLDTIALVGPELDEISQDLHQAQTQIQTVDPQDYPEKLGDLWGAKFILQKMNKSDWQDLPARDLVQQLRQQTDTLVNSFAEYQPAILKLPAMMGAGESGKKKYLVLFQNNNELRPTGGFLTAYAIIYLEDGKVTTELSDDIYELDKKFTKRIAIPEKLGKYLTTEKYWHLRDMNIDPDFAQSMATFLEHYQTMKGEPQDIDGIIALDTQVLTGLIDVLGPVEVPGYGTFSTELDKKYNAPQIVIALSEIITKPTPYLRTDRKGVLGPMMAAILTKVYSATSEQFPNLFQVALSSLNGKHVQAYFIDPELQKAAEKINAAGRMEAPVVNQDFLAIVDANLGGAKSNLFIDYDVKQTILPPEAGRLTKQLSINYRNSQPGDNCNLEAGQLCLNATNNDWQRIYLPANSELINAKGYKSPPTVAQEEGFTVIDGYFSLNPDSTAKIELEYSVPYTDTQNYNLKIWQQGGLRLVKHLIDVNENQEEIMVTGDTAYKASF